MADQELPLKASPSLLYQNLTFSDGKFVYVHKTEAHVCNVVTKEVSSVQLKEKAAVHQARFVALDGQHLLALATHSGTQFWDLNREKQIASVPAPDDGFLSRGIASLGSLVFVGHSTGSISVIEAKSDGAVLAQTLGEHREVITDIASGSLAGEPVFVSADIGGDIIVWSATDLSVKFRLEKLASSDTCTSIAVTPTHIACGFGSGKIRLFNASGQKAVEIAAHSRWINSIDYSLQSNTLASAAEDQLLQFWKLPSESDPKVALKGSKFLKDCLLSGVKFTDDGRNVACVAYDTEKLFLFDAPV